MDADKIEWEGWGAMIGGVTLILEAGRRVAAWMRERRQALINQIEALRSSHEANVQHMDTAHQENSNRLLKLENNEMHNTRRLEEMSQTIKDIDRKQDDQTKLLMSILKGKR
jgi:hypothetical protein